MEEQALEEPRKKRKIASNDATPLSLFAPKERARRNAITEEHLSVQELQFLQNLAMLPFHPT